MTEERKDEIGKLFLLREEVSIEELNKLEIQEIIFLIHSAKYFKEKKAFLNDNFDKKIEIFLRTLMNKLKNTNELYIAYDKNTNYPYIDADDRVWMFSKLEYGENAEDYFMQQLIMLEMKKITGEEIVKTFVMLHDLGMKKILLDNGQYNIEIERDEILPPPDFSGIPEINIPVTNPKLQYTMIRFFQLLYSKNNFEGKELVLHKMEDEMLDEVINSKYLLPMQLKEKEASIPKEQGIKTLEEGTIIQFASLIGKDNTSWLPAFTDWMEFEKVYDKNVWSSNITTYDELLALSDKMDGIVINCRGISFRLNDKNKKMIEEYKKEKSINNGAMGK